MNYAKRFAVLVLLITIITSVMPGQAYADARKSPDWVRVLFVIDISGSMNTNDTGRLVPDLIKMMVDSLFSQQTKVGFITYNDEIVARRYPDSIQYPQERAALKNYIDQITYDGNTDIGLALRHGTAWFEENPHEKTRDVIVLISDGRTDLRRSQTGRTMLDSLTDEKYAIERAAAIGCPIYTIGVSYGSHNDSFLETEYLNEISNVTGGKTFVIDDLNKFQGMYTDLFETITGVRPEVHPLINSGEYVSLDGYSDERNLIFLHMGTVKSPVAEGFEVYKSTNFFSIKLESTKLDNINIAFTEEGGSSITTVPIVADFTYALIPEARIMGDPAAHLVTLKAGLYNDEGKEASAEMYDGLTAEIEIWSPATGLLRKFPVAFESGVFQIDYHNNEGIPMEVMVRFYGNGVDVSAEGVLHFSNNPPAATDDMPWSFTGLRSRSAFNIELAPYFYDPDGDDLYYRLEKPDDYTSIEDGILLNTRKFTGEQEMVVLVTDGRGGELQRIFTVSSEPFWVYYREMVIIVAIAIIGILLAIIALLLRKRPEGPPLEFNQEKETNNPETVVPFFNNIRFEGYFLKTASGQEVPAIFWSASYINQRREVSLWELFSMMDVEEKLPEARKIYFGAGMGGKVVFQHSTDCEVGLGKKPISRDKQEVLNLDDRLFIVFEDGVTEIEIRVKKASRIGRKAKAF